MMLINCQSCGGPILKDVSLEVSAPVSLAISFSTKCVHCKALNKVEIRTMLEKQVRINGVVIGGTGEKSAETAIRTLAD